MIFGFPAVDIFVFGILPLLTLGVLAVDKKFWAATFTILGLAIAGVVRQDSLLEFNADTLITIASYVGIWLVIGAVFSFVKWKLHTAGVAKQFVEYLAKFDFDKIRDDAKTSWMRGRQQAHATGRPAADIPALTEAEEQSLNAIGDETVRHRRRSIASDFSRMTDIVKVTAKEPNGWTVDYETSTLVEYATAWIIWWPFYVVLAVFNDFILNLIDWFITTFGQMYRRILNSSFSEIQ
jgi:hypothetical protein